MAYVLIGFMGAGKTTLARELARELGSTAHDSDEQLERSLGHSVAVEFEQSGEDAFRAREEELAVALLAAAGGEDVVALGGGSVLSERVRDGLRGHRVVLLDVDAETAWERVGADGEAERPLARDRDAFAALLASRSELYEELADAIVPAAGEPSGADLARALRAHAASPAGTRLLWARTGSGEYPVLVAEGLLAGEDPAGAEAIWPLDRARSRAFCVADEAVAALYGGRLGRLATTLTVPSGEGSKTLAQAERVWEQLVEAGMTRADHVVALGGGVAGDLAGFCAATYQRGVPVVQVPTTVVAQVDSAYGGKTGVDLPQAKNYVGVYHQPAGVLVDPGLLSSLPERELAAGWVEVLKTGLIAGGRLWERVRAGARWDPQTILECARLKLAVVAADERDGGPRQALNLGHTVGHAIETATGYTRYRHGEAVGLGLLAALRLSGREELRELVLGLLQEQGLPDRVQGASAEAVLQALGRDKKRVGDRVPFVLVNAPGEVQVGCEVPEEDVRAAVAELAA